MATKQAPVKLPAGLELAYDVEKGNVRNALDAFVLSLHWSIVRTGLLQRGPPPGNQLTERLPSDWCQQTASGGSTRTLSLFYYDKDNADLKYELKVIELTPNDMVAVTFFRSSGGGSNVDGGRGMNEAATSSNSTSASAAATANRQPSKASSGEQKNSAAATFQIGSFIRLSAFDEGRIRDNAADVYEHADALETQLYESIVEPLGLRVLGQPPVPGPYDGVPESSSSNTGRANHQPNPLADDRFFRPEIDRRPSPLGPIPLGPLHIPPIGGPGGLGRSDLDPLGRFGAGNVLDPRGFRPSRGEGIFPGPPGSMPIPPGVRFDPFGPPNPTRPDGGTGAFAVPNPDHERPFSSDYDDMFM